MVHLLPVPRVTLLVRSLTPRTIDAARATSARARLDGVAVAMDHRHLLPGPWHPPIHTTVDSLWLPVAPGRLLSEWRRGRLVGTASGFTTPRLVVPWAVGSGKDGERQASAGLIAELNRHVTAGRITLAISPDNRHPVREQLMAMSALRRLAEEWDYDIALDLSGRHDGPWEAEAALHRLMPRLTTVRIGPLSRVGWTVSTDLRLANRVLTAARDIAFTGTFVITSSEGPLPFGRDGARRVAVVATMIRDRFAPDSGVWPPSRSSEPSRWVV